MTHLPSDIFPRTQQLIMTGNNLGKLNAAAENLSKIAMFDFQHCSITKLTENVWRILTRNTDRLLLASNKITELPRFFETHTLKTQLWLAGNPYKCNCGMMWMRDWLVNATNVRDKENITCGPGQWKGIGSI